MLENLILRKLSFGDESYMFALHISYCIWFDSPRLMIFSRWHRLPLPVAVLPIQRDARRTGRGRVGSRSPGAPPGRQLRTDCHRPRHGVRPGRGAGGRGLQLDYELDHHLGVRPALTFGGPVDGDASGSYCLRKISLAANWGITNWERKLNSWRTELMKG